MARTANRGMATDLQFTAQAPVWRLGKYLRLSKDDFKRGNGKDREKDVSDSIENQRKILNEFEQMNADEFEYSEEYVDDGFTGTDADRDGFQRLLNDLRTGKINCVIIKDLSRMSRDYVEAGILIDRLFVQMNVRFISLHERLDSYKEPDSVTGMVVPITNIMNDQYCYQTSKKIRQVFDNKRRNGEYIGGFACHGYIKDPNNRHKLIVDEEAAEIVKQIYSMYISGMSQTAITIYLNDHGIPSPAVYKHSKGMNYKANLATENPIWRTRSIGNILSNRMYTGDLVQGRRRVKSYKIHTVEDVPEDEWVIVEDTHEAIIDKVTFQKVQELLRLDTRTAPQRTEVYPFSGFLKCADCGKAVVRSASKGVVRYFCSTYKISRKTCTMHAIKHNRLEAAVLYAIRQQVYIAVSCSETIARISKLPHKKNQSARIDDLIAGKEKELAKVIRYRQAIYEDWKDGEINQTDYRQMRDDYNRQEAAIQTILANLKTEREKAATSVDLENPFLTAFRKHENIEELTREVMVDLIDRIKVFENGDISVKFKFADGYRRIAEFIEANTAQAAG